MRNLAVLPFAAVIAVLSFFSTIADAQRDNVFIGIVESVEARVNDEVITTSEVEEVLQQLEYQLRRPFQSLQEYERNRQIVLQRLVEESLLVQEARKQGIRMEVSEKEIEVEKEFQKRVERQGGPGAMIAYLNEAGLTEAELRESIGSQVEREYLRNKVLQRTVSDDRWVSDEDINQFKVENPEQARNIEKVDISHILLALPENSREEETAAAYEQAVKLTTRIRAEGPESFGEYAARYSDHEGTKNRGGNLGEITRGELFPEFDEAFELNPGEISDPIRTARGYHILMVNKKQTIAEAVQQYKLRKGIQDFIAKLKEDAVIDIKGAQGDSSLLLP